MMDTREHTWREDAINHALHAQSFDGNGRDALLRAIRRHDPSSVALLLEPDREQLLRFLKAEADEFRSLLAGTISYETSDNLAPYVGWYAVTWQGAPFEIAIAPADYAGYVVCIGHDAALLRRFADALTAYTIRPAGRSLYYSMYWRSDPDLDAEIGKVTWDDLVLPPQLQADLRDAVEGFFKHRDAFARLGFAWRRGILMIGPPGTGKTMVCKAIAAALPELPFLYVRDFREGREPDAIKTIFERARQLAPCILAFEDIDGLVVEGNRTVFLNELDGLRNNEGLLIVASSNHPGKIDEALLKRPSRFDRVFHLGLPGYEERREFCRRLLSRSSLAERIDPALALDDLARQVAERSDGFTPAYLKEVFTSAALARAQVGAMLLDEQFAAAVLEQANELRQYLRRMRDPEAFAEMSVRGDQPMGFRR